MTCARTRGAGMSDVVRSVATGVCLALVCVVLFAAPAEAQGAGNAGKVVLVIKRHFLFTDRYDAAISIPKTVSTCIENGGTPAADPNYASNKQVLNLMQALAPQLDAPGFFNSGDATPPAGNPDKCAFRVTGLGNYTTSQCTYRWRHGFYDHFMFLTSPGCPYWQGGYKMKGLAIAFFFQYDFYANEPDGDEYMWSTPDYTNGLLYRFTRGELPKPSPPVPTEQSIIVCEVQEYEATPVLTSKPEQPVIVKGWKDETWAQRHWWVIFLIVAVVLLLVLLALILFCCVTRREPKADTAIMPMVLRERCGRAYHPKHVEEFELDECGTGDVMLLGGSSGMNALQPRLGPQLDGWSNYSRVPAMGDEEAPVVSRVYRQDEVTVESDGDSIANGAYSEGEE